MLREQPTASSYRVMREAKRLRNENRYTESNELIKSLPNWQTNQFALYELAVNCDLNHEHALTQGYLTSIPDWFNNFQILKRLANSYFKSDLYWLAKDTYQRIPYHHRDRSLLLNLSFCYEKTSSFGAAMLTLQQIEGWPRDRVAKSAIARCCLKAGEYSKAITIIKSIENWQLQSELLILIGNCYECKGEYQHALQAYQRILQWHRNIDIVQRIARCHKHLGQHQQAIDTCKTFNEWFKHKSLLIFIADEYSALMNYDAEVAHLKKIHEWDFDLKLILRVVECLKSQSKHKESISLMFSCQYKVDKNELFAHIGLCFFEMNNFDTALTWFIKCDKWRENPKALLGVSLVYLAREDIINYGRIVKIALDKFPEEVSFQLEWLRFLVRTEDEVAVKTYLYNNLNFLCKDFKIQLHILKYFAFLNNKPLLEDILVSLHELYKNNGPFLEKINEIASIEVTKPYPSARQSPAVSPLPTIQVAVSEQIGLRFEQLEEITSGSYLVGSSALKLITGQEEHSPNDDLDFIAFSEPSHEQLERCHYQRSRHIPGLYTRRHPKETIDLLFVPQSHGSITSQILTSSFSRDYTICTLFINSAGVTYDPTGKGVADAEQRILRPTREPKVLFAEDPIRALRAIKYISRGFEPTQELEEALLNWQLNENTNSIILRNAINKALMTENKEKYRDALIKYGLARKLNDALSGFGFNFTTEFIRFGGILNTREKGPILFSRDTTYWGNPRLNPRGKGGEEIVESQTNKYCQDLESQSRAHKKGLYYS